MFLAIDFASNLPIYEQIRREIIKALARGDLSYGQVLPSVRSLAKDIGINLHTVNKAYKLLEEDGLIVMDRRFGSKLVDEKLPLRVDQKASIHENLEFLLAFAKVKGVKEEDLLTFIGKFYEN
ncbi:MAG: GntR family transcriptional regulator [Anaerococcus sp.]|nr:GntR family transcriptional regulator [Anaerococcus sp.]